MDLQKLIGKTNFTLDFIVRSLKGSDSHWDMLMEKKHLKKAIIIPITDIGYLSYIYRVNFLFDDVVDKWAFNVVLKVPTVSHIHTLNHMVNDDFLAEFAGKLAERHNKEIYFYENFGHLIRNVNLAKIYRAQTTTATNLENGFILMKELKGAMPDFFEGLSKLQIENLIRIIADIHALTLSIPNSEEIVENFRFKGSMDQDDGQTKFAAMENLFKLPHEYFRRNQMALERLFHENEVMSFDVHKVFGTPPVLCHGDFWSNNVFFDVDDDGKINDHIAALFDFQFAHPSTGLNDIVRVILVCSNASLKIRYMQEWINLYYETFSLACKNYDIQNPYTLKMVHQMFRYHYPSELLFSYIILLNHYARAPNSGTRTCLLGRMISGFEFIRRNYETLENGINNKNH